MQFKVVGRKIPYLSRGVLHNTLTRYLCLSRTGTFMAVTIWQKEITLNHRIIKVGKDL